MEKHRKEKSIYWSFNTQVHRWLTWILKTIKKIVSVSCSSDTTTCGNFLNHTQHIVQGADPNFFQTRPAIGLRASECVATPLSSISDDKVLKFAKASEVKLRKIFQSKYSNGMFVETKCVRACDHMREEQYFYTRIEVEKMKEVRRYRDS